MQLSLKDAALIKTSAAFLEDKVAELKKYFLFFVCVCVCVVPKELQRQLQKDIAYILLTLLHFKRFLHLLYSRSICVKLKHRCN